MAVATITTPKALTKTHIQQVLERKGILFNVNMTKNKLWELIKQTEVQPQVGPEVSGEY